MTTWWYWWPARGETQEHAKEFSAPRRYGHALVAETVAEDDWYVSGGEWDVESLVVVDPEGAVASFELHMQALPKLSMLETRFDE